ncbi:alpha/beta fold hydrolase [Aquimarina sp. 2201CG14-23]|uniref:alpha/beta fold hydrolase n=1 Tax=Aquimarina mycalae TaxID=3040073 RepID=UPI0024782C02|nr:alpha/beta hydrolase [Aquimarina sp. 2201CG14-23]MDH7447491.1 alpha/beta hydrolase [Aquimarina sp. 2201CG14-23]
MKNLVFIVLSIFNSIVLLAQNNGYVDNHSSKIYYETFGEGDPLLIINGGPGMNSRGFRAIATLLSKNHQTIIYDQRGTGDSSLKSVSSETITMDLMIEDIEKLRKYLRLENWTVMGHSFGGILASYYTSKHPNRINKLILSASGGLDLELLNYVGQNIADKLSKEETKNLQKWTQKINQGDTTYTARLQRGKALAPAYVVDKTHVPTIAERLTQGNSTINMLVFQNLRSIKYDCTEVLKSFQKPVLIIQGKQDIIDQKTAIKAHQIFPNSTLVLLDECGHYGWLDKKEEYLSEIYTFLNK